MNNYVIDLLCTQYAIKRLSKRGEYGSRRNRRRIRVFKRRYDRAQRRITRKILK